MSILDKIQKVMRVFKTHTKIAMIFMYIYTAILF